MSDTLAPAAPWRARSPLAGEPIVRTVDLNGTIGVELSEQPIRHTLLVMARSGMADVTIATIQEITGLALPSGPARVANPHAAAIWSGPRQWLIMSEEDDAHLMIGGLTEALAGKASCSEQTDARVILRLSGPRARRALMKLVGIDVHPAVFGIGAAAMTPVAHIPCHLWRLEDAGGSPAYEIAGPQSSAGSLWHAVVAAAAELGLSARPAQPAIAK